LAAAFAAAPLFAAGAADIKVLSSWNKDNWGSYAPLVRFMETVKQIGGDKIKFVVSGPEVVPPFEQLQPASAGVFDMLFTHGIYHGGSKGLGFAFDAVAVDAEKRRSSGLIGFLDEYYKKHNNLHVFGVVAQANKGYHIFLKEPLSANNDWSGRKIRGTASYHGVIRLFGGAPVVLPGGEVYSALEKGVIDGAAWPAAGMLPMKHFEVAKWRVRPTFGSTNLLYLFNVESWKRLSDADRKILDDAMRKTEREMPAEGDAIVEKEEAELDKLGVKVTTFTDENAKKLHEQWAKSMWELAQKCCADGSEKMREIAKKAGLTN